ncbi:putative secreted protein [Pseudonocardia sp. Ae717_Ps2]|uniref:hypothetical protein n=1 Tax=Pseudonocardia sp. Ae717_Ps2 TaxID=1885573 RepID=UPI00094AB765|nr:hypothetical protein [Pseudonocardia sp. Ae717_Ps2]OLM33815.1 putative secreted protein [Pseudonocardia sp. Ae717_Ps2]
MRSITRAGLRAIGLLAATGALCAAATVPAMADEPGTTWQPELSEGTGNGVVVSPDGARFDRSTAFGAPADEGDTESSADPAEVVPTGLLTLAPHTLDTPTREVDSRLVADTPHGSTASVDVRGKRAGGGWTEWIPAEGSRTELPEAVTEVQGRLVLTATGAADPTVREVTLTATPSAGAEGEPLTEAAPRSYSVFATREGLVGGTTANGHKIVNRDRFVALPSRRALSANGKTDYSVKVCAPNGRCAIAPVWDIGPWNTKDDYWNPSNERQMWKDLPQGVPQAAAARNGHNGGKDQFGRKVANPASIDLGDGIFWDVLGLKDNSQVQVDYLWTGSQRLSAIRTEGAPDVQILARPETGAESVGIAVDATEVPVQCTSGAFVRIGDGQYLPTTAFAGLPGDVPACDAPAAPTPSDASAAGPTPAAPSAPGASAAPGGSAAPAASGGSTSPAASGGTAAPAASGGTAAQAAAGSAAPAAPAGPAASPAPGGSATSPAPGGSAGAAGSPAPAAPSAPAGAAPASPAPSPSGADRPGTGAPAAGGSTAGTPSPGPTPTPAPTSDVPDGASQAARVMPGSAQRAPSGTP